MIVLCVTIVSLCRALNTILSVQIVKVTMGSSVESAGDKVKQKILNRIELKCLEMKELMLSQR